jgi:hypothetical protein
MRTFGGYPQYFVGRVANLVLVPFCKKNTLRKVGNPLLSCYNYKCALLADIRSFFVDTTL